MPSPTSDQATAKRARRAERARDNGARSGGPVTAEGKARSAMNAVTFGLYSAESLLLPGEDAVAFDAMRLGLLREHRPQGPTEVALVHKIAAAEVRRHRLEAVEGRMLDATGGDPTADEAGRARLAMFLRWDGHVERSLMRSITTLARLQKAQGHLAVRLEEAAREARADEALAQRLRAGNIAVDDPDAERAQADLARADAAGVTPARLAAERIAEALPLGVDAETGRAPGEVSWTDLTDPAVLARMRARREARAAAAAPVQNEPTAAESDAVATACAAPERADALPREPAGPTVTGVGPADDDPPEGLFTPEEAARAMAMLRAAAPLPAGEEEGEPAVRRLGRKPLAVREEAMVPVRAPAAAGRAVRKTGG